MLITEKQLRDHLVWRAKVNSLPLDKFVLVGDDGKIIDITREDIESWDQAGFNNVDFLVEAFAKSLPLKWVTS